MEYTGYSVVRICNQDFEFINFIDNDTGCPRARSNPRWCDVISRAIVSRVIYSNQASHRFIQCCTEVHHISCKSLLRYCQCGDRIAIVRGIIQDRPAYIRRIVAEVWNATQVVITPYLVSRRDVHDIRVVGVQHERVMNKKLLPPAGATFVNVLPWNRNTNPSCADA